MSEKTMQRNRLWMLAPAFMILLCLFLARPVQAQAANYKMVYDGKPVKIGAYYYRITTRELEDYNIVNVYQRSSKKKGGYEDLLAGTDKISLSSSFATDGKKIYYGQLKGKKASLVNYTINSKKSKIMKSYTKTYYTVEFEGLYGNNLYVIQRDGKNNGRALLRVNVATGKISNLYKNFGVWNALDAFLGGNSRYLVISLNNKVLEKKDGSQLSKLIVLDKKTGKSRAISAYSILANSNISGADPSFYKGMTKSVIYSEYYNKTWYIKQYTFSSNRVQLLKVLTNVKEIDNIYYNGTYATIQYDGNKELNVNYK